MRATATSAWGESPNSDMGAGAVRTASVLGREPLPLPEENSWTNEW